MPVRIVADSTAYLPAEEIARYGIDVVSLFVVDDGVNRPEVDIDLGAFYERLKDLQTLPTSSQPSPEALAEAFRRATADGDAACGLFISTKMSGTVQAATIAAEMVRAENPDVKIEIVDTEANSMQEGSAVLAAARAAAEGADLDGCVAAARDTIARTRFLFTPLSLEYLRRGGRIGNASALLGSLLQIMPVLTIEEGIVTTAAKVRTRPKALDWIASKFAEEVAANGLRHAYIHTIAEHEAAAEFARTAIAPVAGRDVPVIDIGPTVGLHVGPAIGVVYECERPLR